MSMMDTLFNIFKSANPDASDEDIKSHIDSLKASPEQMGGVLAPFAPSDGSFTPEQDQSVSPSAPDTTLTFPDINAPSDGSKFDTAVSTGTVTNNGAPESLPSASPSPTTPLHSDSSGVTRSWDAPPTPPEPSQPAPEAPQKGESKPVDASNALKTIVSAGSSPTDKAARDAMLQKQQDLKKVGAISGAIGGIGDAIGNAATPFGGKASTGTQEKINENTNEMVDKNKAAFEEKLKSDPTSEISKHYQKVLGLMLGKHAADMNVSGMSAAQISQTLPEVEKYMQKELGMQQIKASKDLQMAMHEQGRQDKLEKDTREWVDNLSKARNGELGVQNGKVDQARHLLQLFKQSEETGKPLSNSQYGELAIGTAALVAGGAQNVSDHTKQMIMQSTAKGDINQALTWAGADPSILGGSTDSVLKNLKDTIIRQGLEAETQRNKFIEDQKAIAPSGLNKTQRDRILNREYGNSVKEFIAPKNKPSQPPKANAAEGTVKKIGSRNFTVMNGVWHEVLPQ